MTAIKAPDMYTAYQDIPSLNTASNDFTTENGVRICCSVYVDIPMNSSEDKLGRKEIFNKLRTICNSPVPRKQQPNSMSGISVEEYQTLEPYVSQYLGCSLQTLRTAIWWQRGALPVDLVLKVQNVIGEPIISAKDITDAFAKKAKTVKEFSKKYPFTPPEVG